MRDRVRVRAGDQPAQVQRCRTREGRFVSRWPPRRRSCRRTTRRTTPPSSPSNRPRARARRARAARRLARLDAFVVGVDPTRRGGVDRRAPIQPRDALPHDPRGGFPRTKQGGRRRVFTPGARVVITHAHPVWRVAAGVEPRDATEMKDDDEDEDHWGLRAVGACSRTRARVVTPSSADAPAPTLFGETETENRDSFRVSGGERADASKSVRGGDLRGRDAVSAIAAALRDKFDCAHLGGSSRGVEASPRETRAGARRRERRCGLVRRVRPQPRDSRASRQRRRRQERRERSRGGRARPSITSFPPVARGYGRRRDPDSEIPTLRAVSDAALAAFADASKREVAAERDARRREGVVAKLPYGLNASAVDVDRLVDKLVSPRRRRGASSRVVSSTRTSGTARPSFAPSTIPSKSTSRSWTTTKTTTPQV